MPNPRIAPRPEEVIYREQERDGIRPWTFVDVATLPLQEREKLKTNKPAVWAAFWSAAAKRSVWMLPDGSTITKARVREIREEELRTLTGQDPDVLTWALEGVRF